MVVHQPRQSYHHPVASMAFDRIMSLERRGWALQDLAAALAEERAEAEVRRKLEARVGGGMSQQRMADLVALAHCRTLAHRLRHARSATLLLAMRPQRSVANRCLRRFPSGSARLVPLRGMHAWCEGGVRAGMQAELLHSMLTLWPS